MKKAAVAIALSLVVTMMTYGSTSLPTREVRETYRWEFGQASGQSKAPATPKVIKDKAEYDAYMAALNTLNPATKAAAMEAFAKQYPNSIVKMDALEQAMAAHQQAGNQAKVESLAVEILALNPENVRALAIVAYLLRAKGMPQPAQQARSYAEKGLMALANWQRPEETTSDQYKKLRDQMADIFYGAIGFAALQTRDYATARDSYLKAVAIDSANLQDMYQLSIAELEMHPMDVQGFWHIAKALSLAQGNAPAMKSIGDYGKAKYRKYHGGEDGWDEWVAQAAKQDAPPGVIPLRPAPTPAELAVKAVQANDPGTLSFSDWEFILSYRDASPANKEAADKVWQAIVDREKQGKARLRIKVKVLHSTRFTMDAAITDENQQDNKVDLFVIVKDAIDPPLIQGTMIEVTGVLTEYRPDPFRFTMREGQIVPHPVGK